MGVGQNIINGIEHLLASNVSQEIEKRKEDFCMKYTLEELYSKYEINPDKYGVSVGDYECCALKFVYNHTDDEIREEIRNTMDDDYWNHWYISYLKFYREEREKGEF